MLCTLTINSCSDVKSYPTLCNRPHYSMPVFPVPHYLPEFAQTHVHKSVMLSKHLILCHPLLLLPSIFPSISLFQWVGSSHQVAKIPELQLQSQSFQWIVSIWFPLGLTGLISLKSKGLNSQGSSPAPQFKSINYLALSLLYGLTLTSIHDYWKNHSFDYTNLCQQSDVSAF